MISTAAAAWASSASFKDTIRLRGRQPWYSLEYQDLIKADSVQLYGNTHTDMYNAQHILGQKQYELTDHLGDVLATLSDKRSGGLFIPYTDTIAGHTVSYQTYKPIVVSAYDYYPFGQYMPGRYMEDTVSHCLTLTLPQTEKVRYWTYDEPHSDPGGGVIVVRGGGVISRYDDDMGTVGVTLETSHYGDGFDYHFGSMPAGMTGAITMGIPRLVGDFTATITDDSGTVLGTTYLYGTQTDRQDFAATFTTLHEGPITMGLTFGIGGYMDDRTGGGILGGTGDIFGHVDVIHFGTPHDTFSVVNVVSTVCDNDHYRYGNNGKMKDNEWAGVGNHYDYGARVHDPRTTRFLSRDPYAPIYPNLTPYQFASNRPIDGVDRDGLEYATFDIFWDPTTRTVLDIQITKDYELKNKHTKRPGIQYNYIAMKPGVIDYSHTTSWFIKNLYGIYQGPDNPKLPKKGGSVDEKDWDYSLPPIDKVDALAMQHDLDYDDAGSLEGAEGVFNPRSTKANLKYIDGAAKVIAGGIDDITGKPFTRDAQVAAIKGTALFRVAESKKVLLNQGDYNRKAKQKGSGDDSKNSNPKWTKKDQRHLERTGRVKVKN